MQKDTFLGENHTFPVIKLPPRGEEESEAWSVKREAWSVKREAWSVKRCHPDGFPPPRGSRWGAFDL